MTSPPLHSTYCRPAAQSGPFSHANQTLCPEWDNSTASLFLPQSSGTQGQLHCRGDTARPRPPPHHPPLGCALLDTLHSTHICHPLIPPPWARGRCLLVKADRPTPLHPPTERPHPPPSHPPPPTPPRTFAPSDSRTQATAKLSVSWWIAVEPH